MTTTLLLTVALVAVVAGARSTWSPCGVSMLATITPLAELGRGHRYRTTALWFLGGATAGGACFGALIALIAIGVHALGPSPVVVASLACVACGLAAASDAGLGGFSLPVHHRQVNERWLDGFRPWVYGAGFGWQIGAGLATYIKTAAVYLVIVLAALTGLPFVALAIGALFGAVRGSAVFLGRRVTSPQALSAFHRRFTALDRPSRRLAVAGELVAAGLFATTVSAWAGLALAAVVLSLAAAKAATRRARAHARTARQPQPLRTASGS
jgi:hypothetical protein